MKEMDKKSIQKYQYNPSNQETQDQCLWADLALTTEIHP